MDGTGNLQNNPDIQSAGRQDWRYFTAVKSTGKLQDIVDM